MELYSRAMIFLLFVIINSRQGCNGGIQIFKNTSGAVLNLQHVANSSWELEPILKTTFDLFGTFLVQVDCQDNTQQIFSTLKKVKSGTTVLFELQDANSYCISYLRNQFEVEESLLLEGIVLHVDQENCNNETLFAKATHDKIKASRNKLPGILKVGVSISSKCAEKLEKSVSNILSMVDFLVVTVEFKSVIYSNDIFKREMNQVGNFVGNHSNIYLHLQSTLIQETRPLTESTMLQYSKIFWQYGNSWGNSTNVKTIWTNIFSTNISRGWLDMKGKEPGLNSNPWPGIRNPLITVNKDHFGVVASWFIKPRHSLQDGKNGYKYPEAKVIVKKIATRFKKVICYKYSIGNFSETWIMRAAVEENMSRNRTLVTVAYGMHFADIFHKDVVMNVIHSASYFNSFHNGTVERIIFVVPADNTYTLLKDLNRFGDLNATLHEYRDIIHERGFKMGFQLSEYPTMVAHSDVYQLALEMSDFVIHYFHMMEPPISSNYFDSQEIFKQLLFPRMKKLHDLVDLVKRYNPDLKFALETTWTSQGVGSKEIFLTFWDVMNTWAALFDMEVYIDAIDAESRVANAPKDIKSFKGWWRVVDDRDFAEPSNFIEKETEPFVDHSLIFDPPSGKLKFDQNMTEIALLADASANTTLTKEDMLLMVTTVSQRFSSIYLYSNERGPQLLEIAARLNLKGDKKVVKFYYHLMTIDSWTFLTLPDSSALGAIVKANSIYDGTVAGIYLYYEGLDFDVYNVTPHDLKVIQRNLETFVEKVHALGFQFGIEMGAAHCSQFLEQEINPIDLEYVLASDFITCSNDHDHDGDNDLKESRYTAIDQDGAKAILPIFVDKVNVVRHKMERLNPALVVKVAVNCGGLYSNFGVYCLPFLNWVETWSVQLNIPVVIRAAFDPNADQNGLVNQGFWTKSNGSGEYIDRESAYFSGNPDSGIRLENSTPASAIIIIFIFVLILVLGGFFMYVQSHHVILTNKEAKEFLEGGNSFGSYQQDNMAYNKELEIPLRKFDFESKILLGLGEFGVVYKMRVDGWPMQVAVKMPKSEYNKEETKSLLHEIKILSCVGQHLNIVNLFGAYTANMRRGNVYLVMELCSNGSLYSRLLTIGGESKSESLSEERLQEFIKFSYGIASGMEFLHQKHVVHSDLATRNVLLDCNNTPKLSDFGLSRKLYAYAKYVKKGKDPLPWRWMAIESLKKCEFDEKSDVWAFGVTCWEIFSIGEIPYTSVVTWNETFLNNLQDGMRLPKPDGIPTEIYERIFQCWDIDSGKRPTMSDMKTYFEEICKVPLHENYEIMAI